MKVLRIDRQSGTWPCEAQEAIGQDVICPLPVEMIADSAVNRNDRPVFVPDFAISGGWTLDILPVIHIGHQGKSIASRFAHRYVSGLSLAAQLHPASGSRFLPLYGAIDTAFTLGPALPLTIRPEHQPDNDTKLAPTDTDSDRTPADCQEIKITVDYTPQPGSKHPFEPVSRELTVKLADLKIAETVELLSRFITLKTGDLLIPCTLGPALSLPLHLDAALTATLTLAGAATPSASSPLLLRLK